MLNPTIGLKDISDTQNAGYLHVRDILCFVFARIKAVREHVPLTEELEKRAAERERARERKREREREREKNRKQKVVLEQQKYTTKESSPESRALGTLLLYDQAETDNVPAGNAQRHIHMLNGPF